MNWQRLDLPTGRDRADCVIYSVDRDNPGNDLAFAIRDVAPVSLVLPKKHALHFWFLSTSMLRKGERQGEGRWQKQIAAGDDVVNGDCDRARQAETARVRPIRNCR
jgi:hypothetical protein